jgi:hypothetical protein
MIIATMEHEELIMGRQNFLRRTPPRPHQRDETDTPKRKTAGQRPAVHQEAYGLGNRCSPLTMVGRNQAKQQT